MLQMANYENTPTVIEALEPDMEAVETPTLTPEQSAEFTDFYRDSSKKLLTYAHKLNAQDPEALTQTAFMNAMRHWGNYTDMGSNREAWVFSILRNAHISECRRNKKIQIYASSEDLALLQLPDQTAQNGYNAITTNANIDSVFDEIAATLTDQEIKDDWLEIFKLYSLTDKTHDEIGEHLGINPNTIKTRIFRLKKRLTSNALLHDMLAPNDTVDV
jgi:RNA polymerase sigma factor (sigma-70 family)